MKSNLQVIAKVFHLPNDDENSRNHDKVAQVSRTLDIKWETILH